MAVFLGPRQTMAEEREGSSRAREMACKGPIGWGVVSRSAHLAAEEDEDKGSGSAAAAVGAAVELFVSLLALSGDGGRGEVSLASWLGFAVWEGGGGGGGERGRVFKVCEA